MMQVSNNVFMLVIVIAGIVVLYHKRETLFGKLSNGAGMASRTIEPEGYFGNKSGRREAGTLPIARFRLVQYGANDAEKRTYPLPGLGSSTGAILIGSSPECDITINDPYLSRKHAYLWMDDQEIMIEDNNSSNGIYNSSGKAVDNLSLDSKGTVFYLANIKFRFEAIDIFASHPRKRQSENTKPYEIKRRE